MSVCGHDHCIQKLVYISQFALTQRNRKVLTDHGYVTRLSMRGTDLRGRRECAVFVCDRPCTMFLHEVCGRPLRCLSTNAVKMAPKEYNQPISGNDMPR